MQKNETGPIYYTIHKNQLKVDFKDLNLRPETIKLLKENVEEELLNISLGNDCLDLTPKAKINNWNYIKLKCLCTAKKTTKKKMKRQPTT